MNISTLLRLSLMRLLPVILALVYCCSTVYGQTFHFAVRDEGKKKTAVALKAHGLFDTIVVYHEKWPEMVSNSSWSDNLQFKSVQGFVRFYVDHKYPVKIHNPYTFRLTYKVYGYGNAADTNAYTTYNDTLTIGYKPDSLASFQDVQFKKYSNFHKMMVVLTGLYEISGAGGTPAPVVLGPGSTLSRLNFNVEANIQVQPFYKKVKVGSNYIDVYTPLAPALKVGWAPEGDKLRVQWNLSGANITDPLDLTPVNYELEWTYLDNYKVNDTGGLSTLPSSALTYNFRNNSTRVILDINQYKIPLVYQCGHLVFRVRMVRPDMIYYRYPQYGAWSLPDNGTLASAGSQNSFPISAAHMSDSINWQYTVSFAEQGKYKQVMSYYDGMLKNRQSITRFNSQPGKLIATEQIYDYEGRPAISILPTPVTSDSFRYKHNLSLNASTAKPYKAADFDYLSLSICPKDLMPSRLAANALANIYYSPLNPEKQGFQKFVPDAGGYPFVQTLYSPGYDERVEKQGGAGDSLQIGTNHTVKNSYVGSEQMDLNRMFGLDIGWSGFYRKTVSRDPNGQLSLSITDYKGKPVSTSLVGIPDTIGHAITANTNVPDTTAYSEDFIQGTPQQIMNNKRVLDKLFFNEASGNSVSQYKVNLSPFPTFCPGKYLNVAMSYDYKVVDECGSIVTTQSGVLGQTGVSSTGTVLSYTSPLNSFAMEQGKHNLHKELTINTDEVRRAVDVFMGLTKGANCLRSEQSFIKETVLSKTFPCPETYETRDCNTCDGKKYQMMQELWPNKDGAYVKRKYGYYDKNNGTVTGNDNSIFTRIKCPTPGGASFNYNEEWRKEMTVAKGGPSAMAPPPPPPAAFNCPYYRYQDTCVVHLPASVTKFGRTYTNLRELPVDTFIYIFNDSIAEALLPLHPEYCKLFACADDVFEQKLRSIPDAKVAEALNLLTLGDIIAADPLYAKMLARPGVYPNAFDTLAYSAGRRISLENLALVQAYCNCSDSVMLNECYQRMFRTPIDAGQLLNGYVKARYNAAIIDLYIGNRRRYLFNLNPILGQPDVCRTCEEQRMILIPQPVFMDTYNPNGTLATDPGSFLATLQNVNPGAANQAIQYNAYLFDADSLNAAQNTAINAYNNYNTALCTGAVDQIITQLVNCADATALNTVRTKLLALCSSGAVANGAYTPDQIRTALTTSGIALDDLCNPYLVNYDNTMNFAAGGPGSGKFLCSSNKFYNDATNTLNGNTLSALKTPGSSYIMFFAVGNEFDQAIKTALNNVPFCNISTIHPAGSSLYTVVYSLGADSVKLFIRAGSQGDCANPFALIPGQTLSLSADCINNVPFASFANGYIGKYQFAVIAKRTSGSQTTQCILPSWTNKVPMNIDGENKLAACVPCAQMRNLYLNFWDTLTAYQVKGADHPYYKTMLRNFMNSKLRKAYTTEQYERFIESCALADSMRIPMYTAYAYIPYFYSGSNPGDTVYANQFLRDLKALDTTISFSPMIRYVFSSNPPSRVLFDFNVLPKNKLRMYRNYITAYSSAQGTGQANQPLYTVPTDIGKVVWRFEDYNVLYASFTYNNIWGPSANSFISHIGSGSELYGAFGDQETFEYFKHSKVTSAGVNVNDATRSADIAKLKRYMITNNIPGVLWPTLLSTADDQYELPEKKAWLRYNHALRQFVPNRILDTLQPQYVGNLSAFNGKLISYGHPAQPGNIQNLYVLDPATATDGTRYAKLDEILSAVKTYFMQQTGTPGLFFTGTNTRQIQPNNRLTAFRCRDSAFWFRHFDSGDTLYNVFVRIPAYVDTSLLPGYRVDAYSVNPGEGNSYSFKLQLSHTNPNVALPKLELDGYTDFVVAKNMVLKDVLLAHAVNEPYPVADTVNNCERRLLNAAILEGKIRYRAYIDSVRERLYAGFYNHLRDTGVKESLTMSYRNQRFNYTLYYYDRAGNLVRTVPPAGTVMLANTQLPQVNTKRADAMVDPVLIPFHHKASNYQYNTLNQVVAQTTPDGGTTEYFYDAAGRAVFSQNARQRTTGQMTYTLYDKQGRIVETGQTRIACAPYFSPTTNVTGYPCAFQDPATGIYWPFPHVVFNLKTIPHTEVVNYVRSSSRSEVVVTNYDEAAINTAAGQGMGTQENLRKRVAAIRYFDFLEPMDTAFQHYNYGMHFSYDIAGNVKTLIRDYPAWKQLGQQFKRIDYDYDLISGKINLLSYNRSFADQFFQRYDYDADNRIVQVETSQDGYMWKRDAAYEYYAHGPLARMSLGDLRVQGVDYAYTIQGWLKAINGDMLDTAKDMGRDGIRDAVHARDAVALSLDYFKGDYKPIGNVPVMNTSAGANMYNGNIPRATTAIAPFRDLSTNYTYDQLNRLVKASYATLNRGNGQLTPVPDYQSQYTYDPDGNLLSLQRNGNNPSALQMDNLVYRYDPFQYNNKLQNVNDYAANNYQNDIAQHTNTAISRYLYDQTGNVIKDLVSGQDTIQWNHYNKVTDTRNNAAGNSLAFEYDGMGNRYLKSLITVQADTTNELSDYYVRDAQGNILAVYKNESRFVMTKQQWIEYVTHQFVQQCGLGVYLGNLITPYYSQNGAFKYKVIEEVSGNENWVSTQLNANPVSFYTNKNNLVFYNLFFAVKDYQEQLVALADYDRQRYQYTLGDGVVKLANENNTVRWSLLGTMILRNYLPRMDVLGLLCQYNNTLVNQTMQQFNLTPTQDCLANAEKISQQLRQVPGGTTDFMTSIYETGLNAMDPAFGAFLFDLFKPTTKLGKNNTQVRAFELLCQVSPNLLVRTMELSGLPKNGGCPANVSVLFQQVGNNADTLLHFMNRLRAQGLQDQFKTEYRNFMEALAVDNTLANFGVEDSMQSWVIRQACSYMPVETEQFMESKGLGYEAGNYANNQQQISDWMGGDYMHTIEFSQAMDEYARQNNHVLSFDNFLKAMTIAPEVLHYNYYTGKSGILTPSFQMVLQNYVPREKMSAFYDNWSRGRELLMSSNQKSDLLAAIYDNNVSAFIQSYVGNVGNYDVINKGLYMIGDLNLQYFVSKIRESQVTGYWCAVTTIDSIIHNTYVNALKYQRLSLSSHHLYGSSRLGTRDYPSGQYYALWDNSGTQPVTDTAQLNNRRPWYSMEYQDVVSGLALAPYGMTDLSSYYGQHQIGKKQYEFTNHLGNVQATLTDYRTITYEEGDTARLYNPVIATAYDYYPFGMLMPGRYVSDTSAQCVTVTQSKWTTKWVLDCYDVYRWIWPGFTIVRGSASTAKAVINASNPDANGIELSIAASGGVDNTISFEFDVVPDMMNEIRLETSEFSGSAGTVEFMEDVGGAKLLSHGSLAIDKVNQSLKLSVMPKTTKLRMTFRAGTLLGYRVKVRTVCTWKPVMVQENILVDVCDREKDRYRFGFNGQEKVNEWAGIGNHNTAEFWEYDTRTGRRGNIDPMWANKPWMSTYHAFSNSPINKIDPNGAVDDWVQTKEGQIEWDRTAKSQETTKEGSTYLGRDLTFTFNSYIDKTYDGSKPPWDVTGIKILSTIQVDANTDLFNNLMSVNIKSDRIVKSTADLWIFKGKSYYPGTINRSLNIVAADKGYATFEQHASVPAFEEFGLNLLGYDMVNVAQKLTLGVSTTKLSIIASTDVFPSAILTVNGIQLFQYNQPSFKATHSRTSANYVDDGMGGGMTERERKKPEFFTRFKTP